MQASNSVIDFAQARLRLRILAREQVGQGPSWKTDIPTCCAYARMLKAEHAAESARIDYEAHLRVSSWPQEDDLRERVDENNRVWNRYIALCAYLAMLPAASRNQARVKRDTIGKMWLSPDSSLGRDPKPGTFGQYFADMRTGCLADDHLFPPSMKLARR